jgi:hypothetical protein
MLYILGYYFLSFMKYSRLAIEFVDIRLSTHAGMPGEDYIQANISITQNKSGIGNIFVLFVKRNYV